MHVLVYLFVLVFGIFWREEDIHICSWVIMEGGSEGKMWPKVDNWS